MDGQLDKYLCEHSEEEPLLLQRLRRETYVKFLNPRMVSGHLQGRILVMLCQMLQPKRVLELGTFTGYATLCFAEGTSPEAEIHSIEHNDEFEDHHKEWFGSSPYGHKIQMYYGDAKAVIPTLSGTFDLVFLDHDKRQYKEAYELCLEKMHPRAFLLADNTLWNGKLFNEIAHNDSQSLAIAEFNDYVAKDNRVEKVMLPLRDGLTIIRKK